jgi:hypothetical protein
MPWLCLAELGRAWLRNIAGAQIGNFVILTLAFDMPRLQIKPSTVHLHITEVYKRAATALHNHYQTIRNNNGRSNYFHFRFHSSRN